MSKPRRILILVTSLDRGGIETMIMNYYRKLDRTRWQFDFLINRKEKGAYEQEIEELGGRVFRMGAMYPWRYVQYRREFLDFLRKHPEYRTIHSHLEERSYWPLSLAQKAGIPTRICHAHNVYPFDAVDGKTYFRQWFRRGLRKRGLVTAKLACSRHAGKWLFGDDAQFSVITNAIDFSAFAFGAAARSEVRRELGIGEREKVAGFAGRLVTQKNPEFALRVFSELPDREEWRLVIVGKGELESRLRESVRELGLEKSVIFAGEVSAIAKYYAAFDVLLMPSRYEGLGMVAIEAGANGLPVMASENVPQEANVVKNTTFIDLGDVAGWLGALSNVAILSSKDRSVKMTTAMKPYDIDVAVDKLEKLYEDIAH